MTPTNLSILQKLAGWALSVLVLTGAAGATASGGLLASPVVTRQVADSDSSIAWGEAEAELGQRVDEILAVIADYEGYAGFMPNFRRSKVLAMRGSRARVYIEVSAAAGALLFWGQLDLTERGEEANEIRVVEARLLEGNIDAFRAEWRLTRSAGGEHTKVAFRIFVDPDLPLPSSLISRENERAARRTIEALRSRLEGKLP